MKNGRQLIEEADVLIGIAEVIQNEAYPLQERQAKQKELDTLYHAWYRNALQIFHLTRNADNRQKFVQEYEGNIWSNKIIKFLSSGIEPNAIYIPDNPFTTKHTYPFLSCFKEPLLKQCNLLSSQEYITSGSEVAGDMVSWNQVIRKVFAAFVKRAEEASTNNEKKLTYEYLAVFLISSIDGLIVAGHNQRGTSEETDVWVANEASDPFWQQIGPMFFMECKNWSEPADTQVIHNIETIMNDKHTTFAILLSKCGVTGSNGRDAVGAIYKAFSRGKYILVLDHNNLLEMVNGMPPIEKIKQKYRELLMKS